MLSYGYKSSILVSMSHKGFPNLFRLSSMDTKLKSIINTLSLSELELIRRDIQSRLWCTYRHGFSPLGEVQLTTDKGWGCMLRCGQMVLAQALIDLHLGRDWFWTPDCRDATYLKIVNRFEDVRNSFYSIHQIAQMESPRTKRSASGWDRIQ